MRSTALAALLALLPAAAWSQCYNCILNSAAPQTAQFNISSATIRGALTVGSLNLTSMSVSGTLTAAQFVGGGVGLTGLSASQLGSGTVPSARLTGSYTGVTGVGTLTAGSWTATAVGTQYGGTGKNWAGVAAGALPYFSATGTLNTLTSPAGQRVLMTTGSGAAPVWTSSPTLTGQNFSAIPLTALANGTLQAGVQVPNASLVSIDAAKVSGNISGGAATLTIPLPIANLAAGTLPTTNAASSVTVTGTQIGTFGGPSTLAQFRVGGDGRIYDAKQFNLVAYSTAIAPGALPAGVTIGASQVTAGLLANNVQASSVAASGVTPGSYGSAARALTAVVQADGRLTSLSQQDIALPTTQISAGTLPSNVLVPAANIQAGALGSSVRASSVAATGVTPGVYGSPIAAAQLTIAADGRVTSATQYTIPGLSTHTAYNNVDNAWAHAQTSLSSWTVLDGIEADFFAGDGEQLNNLTAANISAGLLGPNVQASSMNATGVTAASYGDATHVPAFTVRVDGRVSTVANVLITGVPAATVPASGVLPGTLGSTVIASSVAVTAVTAGAYGSATQGPTFTVGVDGRLTAASAVTITPAAASVTAGTLGPLVIASSVAATAVTAGSYGSASQTLTATVAGDGRLTALANTPILITESQVTSLVADLAAKASTGTDNSLTRANALAILGANVTAVSSFTVNGALLSVTSSSSPIHYVGTNGSASAPTLTGPQTNTGLFFSGTDVAVTANGTQRALIGGSLGIIGGTGASNGQPVMRSIGRSSADKTDPQFQFYSDQNTGWGQINADSMFWSANGVYVASAAVFGSNPEFVILPGTVQASTFNVTGFSISSMVFVAGDLTLASTSKGICFGTSGCQTAPGVSASGNIAFTGNNSNAGTVSFATATYQNNPWLGRNGVAIDTASVGGITAVSVDGAVQSSGCVVEYHYDITKGYTVLQSTTSDPGAVNGLGAFCVLYETCNPSTMCKCITRGMVRVKTNGATVTGGQGITTSGTRCNSTNNAGGLPNSRYVTADSNNFFYAIMFGP